MGCSHQVQSSSEKELKRMDFLSTLVLRRGLVGRAEDRRQDSIHQDWGAV